MLLTVCRLIRVVVKLLEFYLQHQLIIKLIHKYLLLLKVLPVFLLRQEQAALIQVQVFLLHLRQALIHWLVTV